jgi:hypothetical protein
MGLEQALLLGLEYGEFEFVAREEDKRDRIL